MERGNSEAVVIDVKLQALERAVTEYDTEIKKLFAALPQLMAPPEQRDEKIGFLVRKEPSLR
jgi:hypothetical protein